jgi:protein translocase SecG subunit
MGAGWAETIVTGMAVCAAVLMTFFILLQEGKGGGLASLGGTKAAGVEGVTNPIRRATGWLAGIMFVLLIVLGVIRKPGSSQFQAEAAPAAATGELGAPAEPSPGPGDNVIPVAPPPGGGAVAPTTDGAKTDTPKPDAAKPDAKTELAKPDAEKTEAAKPDAAKAEQPKSEPPKTETPAKPDEAKK